MLHARRPLVVTLALACFAVAIIGCGWGCAGDNKNSTSGSDHPRADHPKTDHPTADHPK